MAYTHPAAERLRQSGGVCAKSIDRDAVEIYLREAKLPAAIAGLRHEATRSSESRSSYLSGLALSLEVMWDLAMEVLGKGDPVPYTRAVEASTGKPPEPSHPEAKRERAAELLGHAGYSTSQAGGILAAVDAWRCDRVTPMASVKALGAAVIAHFDALSAKNLVPHLPKELAQVPRANIDFLPIKEAWFWGSMTTIGGARTLTGAPKYEATYRSMLRCRFPIRNSSSS